MRPVVEGAMKTIAEFVAGVLLLVALTGLGLVVVGLARGGLSRVPAVGLVLLIVAGIPVATRLPAARSGLSRVWTRLRR